MHHPTDLIDTPFEAPVASDCSAPVQAILRFVQQHYAESITIGQLADIARLSPSRLSAKFRTEMGMPPYRYICQLRIRAAQHLLATGRPAAEVAAEVGFFDQSHMHRHFKRSCGLTPSHFLPRRSAGMGTLAGAQGACHV